MGVIPWLAMMVLCFQTVVGFRQAQHGFLAQAEIAATETYCTKKRKCVDF